ncbi:MAG: hypothetical protein ACRD0W_00200 [Acidimicrobiales bacterium]
MRYTIIIPAAALLLIAGCADMLDSTELVCDEFAHHARDGLPAEQREQVVASIGEVIGNADDHLNAGYEALRRTADSPDSSYLMAADMFAQACLDIGWDG